MHAPRYAPFVNVFVPFSLLLALANVGAEAGINLAPTALVGDRTLGDHMTGHPTFARVMYTVWLSLVFATPTVALFFAGDLRRATPARYRYWQLFWAFGFVAYALHAYFATDVWYGGDFEQIVERQSLPVAASNYLLLAVWGLDVAVSLVGGQGAGGRMFYRFQWVSHVLFVGAAFVATVVFHSFHSGTTPKTLVSYGLGWALALAVVLALLTRLSTIKTIYPACHSADIRMN